jgi:hypothetical protein
LGRNGAHLKAAGRVVDSGVDDLAVTGAGAGAETRRRLDHQYLAPGHGQRARYSETDRAGPYHDRIHGLPGGSGGEL